MKVSEKKWIKVCGMKQAANIYELSNLKPDLMGFIFYDGSPRNALTLNPQVIKEISHIVTPVGVFVNAKEIFIEDMADRYGITTLQLHGSETPEFCNNLKSKGFAIIKAFSISEDSGIDLFNDMKRYESSIDYFLFDTKGNLPGGNGTKFNWDLLRNYNLDTPYFLSGGIKPEDVKSLKNLDLHNLIGIDLNSKFESSPGIKNIEILSKFIQQFRNE